MCKVNGSLALICLLASPELGKIDELTGADTT